MRKLVCAFAFCAATLTFAPAEAADANFTMEQALSYPFVPELVAAEQADRIAFVRILKGVRNVWVAEGPTYAPRQITHYSEDDGQEITQLTFSPDGKTLLYVRGGDHDANWDVKENPAPDPASSPEKPAITIWAAALGGGAPTKIAEGDAPAISSRGELAYLKDGSVWTAPLTGKGKAHLLFFDRGTADELAWSPDGGKLAFDSARDGNDHSFIGVYDTKAKTLTYLTPTTDRSAMPRWSPDGTRIAFVRMDGGGGVPRPILKETPLPFSIWVGDAATGKAKRVWQSPDTLPGSYPETAGNANLHWAAGDRIVFLADLDNWPHLYSLPAAGGEPTLLTPGSFMVEHVAESRDRKFMIYDANTGGTKDDDDRRHLFRVPVDVATPVAMTAGDGLEWSPAVTGDAIAFIEAGAKKPISIGLGGKGRRELKAGTLPADYPDAQFVVPKSVSFTSADGWTIHGQLFQKADGAASKPGVIFVHGGPPRQMLLGWHYMDYYSNAYAVNQYLANHGFTVLSVNYRLGIGYGHAFHHPEHAGPAGAAEYQDVVAGAKFLQEVPGVDGTRIGIWGGSYGGYLTAMGLARNSDIFKAGADLHGVHDWSRFMDTWYGERAKRYEKGDFDAAMKSAFESSPIASIDTWKSPVLLIQGDDDRNVNFVQMIDLVNRLEAHHVPFEQIVIPNEIHGFLRWHSWLEADSASANFLIEKLGAK